MIYRYREALIIILKRVPNNRLRTYSLLFYCISDDMTSIQDHAMAKDQARINMRRDANEERRIRYLNAPRRLIGIDTQALDAQVADIRKSRYEDKEADRMESKHLSFPRKSALISKVQLHFGQYFIFNIKPS